MADLEEVESLVACLGDDAARLHEAEPEVAQTMREAAESLSRLSEALLFIAQDASSIREAVSRAKAALLPKGVVFQTKVPR